MGDSDSAGQDLEQLVQHAVDQGILDDQFIQLRNLQVWFDLIEGILRVWRYGLCVCMCVCAG